MKHKLIYNANISFEEAVGMLDKSGIGFLPIVDEKNVLIGIITDGDVRRAILNKKTNLNDIINKKPVVINESIPRKRAIQYLKSIHRRHLPVINNQNQLVDLILLDELEYDIKKNKVVIMAGGLGTRLGDLTKEVPKPMLPVGGKPMLELLIKSFLDCGFRDFYISVNYKSEIIKQYFKDGAEFGVNINYLEEKERMGTAGSLTLIADLPKESFFVINGDILTSVDFGQLLNFHEQNQSFATMCVKEYEYQIPYATIDLKENSILGLQEKPTLKYSVNSGIYVLSPDALTLIPNDKYYDMPTLFDKALIEGKKISGYKIEDYWLDIGQVKDYENALSIYKKSENEK